MNKYYVYEHYKPNCDEPFYVGKGCGNRAHHSGVKRNKWWHNIVNKYGFEVRIIAENLSAVYSLWLENICIKGWGRADLGEGPLVNMTDGGDNPPHYSKEQHSMFGKHHSEETRIKISKAKTGIPSGRKGIPFTDEHRKNISISHKGKPSSRKGKSLSEETKLKISMTRKRLKLGPKRGRKNTEESKEKMKISQQRRRKNEKLS